MKKFIATVLLSSVVAVPAFAADAVNAPAKKAAPAASAQKKDKMKDGKDDCAYAHGGMMGRHGYGMGQYGYGAGYEGDYGMGGHHGMAALDLSKEQQDKITKLSDELRRSNWNTQGQINDENVKLRDLYAADKRDPAAIGKEYQKIFDLKRQMIEDALNTQNRIEEVLTPEQLAKLKEAHRASRGRW